jgi:CheY-like chemotaxis protein
MEAVGRLAGGVAHDFNNMLTVILGQLEIALTRVDPSDRLFANLKQIERASQHSADLTRQLLTFARRQAVIPKVLDLNATLSGMLKMLQRLIGEDIELVWRPGYEAWRVKIDPAQVDQILANLCVNARDAIDGVGLVSIETANVTIDEAFCATHPGMVPGRFVSLVVADNGCGIDRETLDHIFEPFFTTKGVGEGTGLGLSTVYAVISRQGGLIDVDTKPGGGTRITVYLAAPHGPMAQLAPAPQLRLGGTETILLAEDDELLRQLAVETLTEAGYRVIAAQDGAEAEALAREHAAALHVAVLDVVMPKRSGRKVSDTIRMIRPELPIVFMSGYTFGALDDMVLAGTSVLQKPFTRENLLRQVRDALDQVTP